MDSETLNSFVDERTDPEAKVYTDGPTAYKGRENHESVSHSAWEYVRYLKGVKVHTNGVESFWSMLKRAHKGVYHKLSAKHLQRYVSQFAGRQTCARDGHAGANATRRGRLAGRRLMYRDLMAD